MLFQYYINNHPLFSGWLATLSRQLASSVILLFLYVPNVGRQSLVG